MNLTLRPREVLTLIGLTGLTVAPHFQHMNLTVILFFLAVLLLRLLALYRPGLQPQRLWLFVITLIGALIVFSLYPLLVGLEAKIALLCLMLGLKLLELRQRRDLYVVAFLCYFVLITQFLFDQDMALALYVFLLTVAITAVLLDASRHRPAKKPLGLVSSAATLLLQAIPIMLALFFLFPRFAGPLWHLGLDNSKAITGLSDSIQPGSISQLIRSRAVAFRVDFDGPIPPSEQRYWRGIVLWHSDGWRWIRSDFLSNQPTRYTSTVAPVSYSITLEPSANNWLYALDLPDSIPPGARLRPDYEIISDKSVNQRYRYSISSRLSYHTGRLSDQERRLALQLPDNITDRIKQLVATWRGSAAGDREVVQQALDFYRQEAFFYTLSPPRVLNNPVDEFLFETRRGFCENYATSFVTLMRQAGIPARVVAGYQGGEVNPLGDYLIVRQSDAHAWAEVWLPNQGWTRVDPTAAVAPERIERPFDFDLASASLPGLPINFGAIESDLLKRLAKQFRLGIDAANASWHRWVLGYSHERQRQLLSWLGLDFLQGSRLAIGMVTAVGLLLLLVTLRLWFKGRKALDPVQRDYLRFCQRLSRCGLTRLPHEGPEDYAQRIITARPDLRAPVLRIVQLYIALRYGAAEGTANRQQLHRQVNTFRPALSR